MTTTERQALVITRRERGLPLPRTFSVLKQDRRVHVVALDGVQPESLVQTLSEVGAETYGAVFVDLPLRQLQSTEGTLRRLRRLYLYEEDACQEHLIRSGLHGEFSSFYRKLPDVTVVLTGKSNARYMKEQGIDARFVPKAYNDDTLAFDNGGERRVEIGFIGNVGTPVYWERAAFVHRAKHVLGCRIVSTCSTQQYRKCLNNIRFFFSADVGFGEYMAKNFEAMACGCILVAFRQGNGEEEALGLHDMDNCILYENLAEAKCKVNEVKRNEWLYRRIQRAGVEHAKRKFSQTVLGYTLLDIMTRELPIDR